MSLIRIRRIDLSRTRIRKRRLSAIKTSYRLEGGPITRAWLCTPGTLVFRLGDWCGFYNEKNEWVAI
jgi:hypothetical protein